MLEKIISGQLVSANNRLMEQHNKEGEEQNMVMRIEVEIKQTKSVKNAYHEASVNLIFTGKWLIKLHSDLFHEFNISLQQYNTLRILKGCNTKAVTVKYIKNRMLDKMSDASRIVDIMYKKGLVVRTHSSTDQRKVDIMITQKGLGILAEIEKKHDTLYGYLSNLNLKEIEDLNTLLDKVRN